MMHKILAIGILGGMLAACGGGGDTSSSTNSSSISSSPTLSSSSLTISSSSKSSLPISSSSSTSTSSSSTGGFAGNAAKGATKFASNCSACHKDTDGDGYLGEGTTPIDPDDFGTPTSFPAYNASTLSGLATFIATSMGPIAACDTQCSEDTAAYLWTLKDGMKGPTAVAASCANPEGIHYGKRVLHVLTSYEYHNSLSKLFSAPLPADFSSPGKVGLDVEVARLPNHSSEALNETRLNTYYDNAVEIADWAMSTPGALPFSCEDPVQCATDFITEFAYVAYRRALSDVEQAEITNMFEDTANLEDGLKWALRTVLMSPNFLYRSELGTKVSDLLANPVVAPSTQYDFSGTPVTLANITLPPYSPQTYTYTWTGNDLIAITLKGEMSPRGAWPTFTIGVGDPNSGTPLHRMLINHSGYRTYYFHIDKLPSRNIFFLNDAAVGNNYDIPPIAISSLKLGVLGAAAPVQDDVTKLKAADQTAFVLDPYEYASALSFALTGSGPSKSLLDAAVAGELVNEASREAHVDALIDSPMGQAQVARLAGKWFRTDGLSEKTRNNSEFTPQVRASMMQEIREIYKHVFYNGDFPSMYKGDFTFLDSTLSQFYNLPGGGATHGAFQRVDTSSAQRGGVIASGAYMAYNAHMDYTSPIQRSAHFRQDVLCQSIPLPINLEDSAEREAAAETVKGRVEAGNISTADYYDIQTNIPGSSCASCHNAIINPLFGMDDFDNVGRLRPRVNGKAVQDGLVFVNGVAVPQGESNIPITQVNEGSYLYAYDVTGVLSSAKADAAKASGAGLFFTGAKDLGRVIVENDLPGIPACLIEKSTRFALGYTLSGAFLEPSENGYYGISSAQEAQFACIQNELETAYAAAKSPRDVLKAIVLSDAFRFRK